jgi:hypothetical protein
MMIQIANSLFLQRSDFSYSWMSKDQSHRTLSLPARPDEREEEKNANKQTEKMKKTPQLRLNAFEFSQKKNSLEIRDKAHQRTQLRIKNHLKVS